MLTYYRYIILPIVKDAVKPMFLGLDPNGGFRWVKDEDQAYVSTNLKAFAHRKISGYNTPIVGAYKGVVGYRGV